MNYEKMKSILVEIDPAVIAKIDEEVEILKMEYLEGLRRSYDEDEDNLDNYDGFDDYVASEADDYLNFAFGAWLDNFLKRVLDCTDDDLMSLSSNEREQLTIKYFDYFKELSGLGNVSEDL